MAEADRPWTVVSAAKTRRGRRRPAAGAGILAFDAAGPPAGPPAAAAAAQPAPHASPPNCSTEHIQADHARITAWWRAQPSFRRLLDLVTARLASRVDVTRAVCLGAGSFGAPLDAGEHIRRAHIQTDAFLAIVDALSRHSDHAIPCYFQEPLYTAADKAYIHQLGHRVLEPPAAAQIITATTLVFAIHLPTPEYLRCLEPAEPAILVGTAYDRYEE